ncbi:ATP synthase F0, B subunit domain protein, partial [Fusobacterium equinum]
YKEHRKRLQKFQASIKKTLEIKQEIVDNDIITYAEEAQERMEIIENIKTAKKKEEVKVITVGGIEFEVEDDE